MWSKITTLIFLSLPTFCVYTVVRSFAIDDGTLLDHVATMFVAAMVTLAWIKILIGE